MNELASMLPPSVPASPLIGYNNNLRHRGRAFHIQTEDSGVRYAHVITHLFVDGGRIIKTLKTSYLEIADSVQRAEAVRDMMRRQHKAMAVALKDGHLDALIAEATAARLAQLPACAKHAGSSRWTAATSVSAKSAMTRPSSPFARARPDQGGSVFGESVRSDGSLDDAILRYLDSAPSDSASSSGRE